MNPSNSAPVPREQPPLTPVAFEILLCLLDGEHHGYAILRSVEARGVGQIHAGTLYRALSRLVDRGLIHEVEPAAAEEPDERRRYYAITGSGRRTAAAEARRLEDQLGVARAKGLLGST